MKKIINRLKEHINEEFDIETFISDDHCRFILKNNDNTYTFEIIENYINEDGISKYYFYFDDYHTLLYFNKIFSTNFDFISPYIKTYNIISFLYYYVFGRSLNYLNYPNQLEDLIHEFDDRYFFESYFVDSEFKNCLDTIESYKIKLELDIVFFNESNLIELEYVVYFKHNGIINRLTFNSDNIKYLIESYLDITTKGIFDKSIYDLDFNDMKLLHMIKYN